MNIVEYPEIRFLDPVEDPKFCEHQLWKIYYAYRRCYSPLKVLDATKDKSLSSASLLGYAEFIKKHLRHESPLEHVQISIDISDFSRVQSQQITRHRIAAFSQQSQRYVNLSNFTFVNAPDFVKKGETKHLDLAELASQLYQALLDMGYNKEDARGILPNDSSTAIVMTMNLRAWLHFFNERCCTNAQWGVRYVAKTVLKQFRKSFPLIFDDDFAGPKCNRLGYCPEGDRCCGLKPTKEEVFDVYYKWKAGRLT